MVALPLVLHLAVAAPGLVPPLSPPLDAGPLQGRELAAASVGVLAGDAAVVGAGYLALQAFANGTFQPTAANFRTAAYAMGIAALVVPPLGAALLARWARVDPASGAFWKAVLLATLGEAAALGAGFLASPHFWVVLPVQVVAMALGSSFGLHWGPRARAPAIDATRREPVEPPAREETAAAPLRICPDV